MRFAFYLALIVAILGSFTAGAVLGGHLVYHNDLKNRTGAERYSGREQYPQAYAQDFPIMEDIYENALLPRGSAAPVNDPRAGEFKIASTDDGVVIVFHRDILRHPWGEDYPVLFSLPGEDRVRCGEFEIYHDSLIGPRASAPSPQRP